MKAVFSIIVSVFVTVILLFVIRQSFWSEMDGYLKTKANNQLYPRDQVKSKNYNKNNFISCWEVDNSRVCISIRVIAWFVVFFIILILFQCKILNFQKLFHIYNFNHKNDLNAILNALSFFLVVTLISYNFRA